MKPILKWRGIRSALLAAAFAASCGAVHAADSDALKANTSWKGEITQGGQKFEATVRILERDKETIKGEILFESNGNKMALSLVGRVEGENVVWMTDKKYGNVTYPGLYLGKVEGRSFNGTWQVPSAGQYDRFRLTLDGEDEVRDSTNKAIDNLKKAWATSPPPAPQEAAGEWADPKRVVGLCLAARKNDKSLKDLLSPFAPKHRQAWEQAAEAGDGDAQYLNGLVHEFGFGVPASNKTALQWYAKSGEQGNAWGLLVLGHAHRNGFAGLTKDPKKALDFYLQSAQSGNPEGALMAATLYRKGEGTEKSPAKAIEWFTKAAEQGHADAMNRLGIMLDEGEGTSINHEKAFEWYMKAAQAGNAVGMNNVSVCFGKGEGVARDSAKEDEWAAKAKAAGYVSRTQSAGIFQLPPVRKPGPVQIRRPGVQAGSDLGRRQLQEQMQRESMQEGMRQQQEFQRELINRGVLPPP